MARRQPQPNRDQLEPARNEGAPQPRAHQALRQPAIAGLAEDFAVAVANAWDADDRDSVSRLLHVHGCLVDLLRRATTGEDVQSEVGQLFRAATRRTDSTHRTVILVRAIESVASYSDEDLGAMLNARRVPATDDQLCELVAVSLHDDETADRLRRHPSAVAAAVRTCRRRRGRPRAGNGAPSGGELATKWDAIAPLVRHAGLGDLTATSLQELWLKHRPKIPGD